jgi:hypothetical protein
LGEVCLQSACMQFEHLTTEIFCTYWQCECYIKPYNSKCRKGLARRRTETQLFVLTFKFPKLWRSWASARTTSQNCGQSLEYSSNTFWSTGLLGHSWCMHWVGVSVSLVLESSRRENPETYSGFMWYDTSGRAIAQAVSRWFPTAAAQVRARVWSCRISSGQSGVGAGFLRILRFPLTISIPPIAPQSPSSIIWGWYNRPVVAAVPSGLSLTLLSIIPLPQRSSTRLPWHSAH